VPWNERAECWVPSRRETRKHARSITVTYEVDDSRIAARLAAEKYAEADFRHNTFTYLEVRVRTVRGLFDVVVRIAAARPGFHEETPVHVETEDAPTADDDPMPLGIETNDPHEDD
jgi:hypothetical protein